MLSSSGDCTETALRLRTHAQASGSDFRDTGTTWQHSRYLFVWQSWLAQITGVGTDWVGRAAATYLVRCILSNDKSVDVGQLVGLSGDGGLEFVVLALVVDDDVHLAGGATADVRPKHNGVRGVTRERLHVRFPAVHSDTFKIAMTAVIAVASKASLAVK